MEETDGSELTSASYEKKLRLGMIELNIPLQDHDGLVAFITRGVPTGSFLRAVLTNNLREACNRADDDNKKALYNIVFFLYNYAPMGCWGSEANYTDWRESFKKQLEDAK